MSSSQESKTNANSNGLTNGTSRNSSCHSPESNDKTTNLNEDFHFSELSLDTLREMHSSFSTARNWDQFHTPRNILMALVGEVGEVAEHFQWKSDAECQVGLPSWTPEQRTALGEELSDVLVYLVRLADRCQIDLSKAVLDKMAKNEAKYPVEKAFGSAKKYNEL